jgi:hypothetical protein
MLELLRFEDLGEGPSLCTMRSLWALAGCVELYSLNMKCPPMGLCVHTWSLAVDSFWKVVEIWEWCLDGKSRSWGHTFENYDLQVLSSLLSV